MTSNHGLAALVMISLCCCSPPQTALSQLNDDDPDVRQQAIDTLAKRRQASAFEAVENIAKLDNQRYTRATAIRALPALDGRRAVAVLRTIATGPKEPLYLRVEAVDALVKVGNKAAIEAMIDLWNLDRNANDNGVVQGAVVAQFGAMAPKAKAPLLDALHSQTANVRANAAMALSLFGSTDAVEPISELLHDPDPFVRAFAESALRRLRKP